MRWRGRKQSSNIEDHRGSGGGGMFGSPGRGLGRGGRIRFPGSGPRRARSGGIGGIVILVVLFFALRACGIDPMQILAGGGRWSNDVAGAETVRRRHFRPQTRDRWARGCDEEFCRRSSG